MPAVCATTATGTLTINSVLMHTSAWNVLDCTELWLVAAVRGDNITIPYVNGRRALPYRIDEATFALRMAITGDVNSAGVKYADPWVGLQANLDYLRANVVDPPTAPSATRAATLVMPSGVTRTANVQVLELEILRHGGPHLVDAALHLRIPAGRFA